MNVYSCTPEKTVSHFFYEQQMNARETTKVVLSQFFMLLLFCIVCFVNYLAQNETIFSVLFLYDRKKFYHVMFLVDSSFLKYQSKKNGGWGRGHTLFFKIYQTFFQIIFFGLFFSKIFHFYMNHFWLIYKANKYWYGKKQPNNYNGNSIDYSLCY